MGEREDIKERYTRVEIDLATARTDEEIHIEGNYLSAVSGKKGDNTTFFKLNHRNARPIYPSEIDVIAGIKGFDKIYLTNSAQTGEKLILYVGGGLCITTADRPTKQDNVMINVVGEDTAHWVSGDEFETDIWQSGEYTLYCSAMAGTNPTLDVLVQVYDPTTGVWTTVIQFAQLTAVGNERFVITDSMGWKQRIRYQTTGTGALNFDFKVGGIFKR